MMYKTCFAIGLFTMMCFGALSSYSNPTILLFGLTATVASALTTWIDSV